MSSTISGGAPFGAIGRRRFIQGFAAAGTLAAATAPGRSLAAQPSLSGTNFDLTIGETPINVTGKKMVATGINGGVPGPVLRWREGDMVTLNVTNRLAAPSSGTPPLMPVATIFFPVTLIGVSPMVRSKSVPDRLG